MYEIKIIIIVGLHSRILRYTVVHHSALFYTTAHWCRPTPQHPAVHHSALLYTTLPRCIYHSTPLYTTVHCCITQYTVVHHCISTSQYTAVYYSVPMYTTVHRCTLLYTVVHYSTLFCTTVCCSIVDSLLLITLSQCWTVDHKCSRLTMQQLTAVRTRWNALNNYLLTLYYHYQTGLLSPSVIMICCIVPCSVCGQSTRHCR